MPNLQPVKLADIPQKKIASYAAPQQTSRFLRYSDKMERCAKRRCGSPTPYKVRGVPYCSSHALSVLDDLLNEFYSSDLHACNEFGHVTTGVSDVCIFCKNSIAIEQVLDS